MSSQNFEPHAVIRCRHFIARPATAGDVAWIAENLREADRLEVERMYLEPPGHVLRHSLDESILAWTAVSPEGQPVAMWGVSTLCEDTGIGVPWLMGTDVIRESLRDFRWLSQYYDQVMCHYFDWMCNLVDAEYTGAHRWLKWLGYQKGITVKSPKGYDFIIMYKGTDDVR